jgi:hypothetical protein
MNQQRAPSNMKHSQLWKIGMLITVVPFGIWLGAVLGRMAHHAREKEENDWREKIKRRLEEEWWERYIAEQQQPNKQRQDQQSRSHT